MPQLDFREALSTPEEKLLSPSGTVAAVVASTPDKPAARDLLRGIGLTRSAWANIVFVAIASVGGLVCAFYFFNGGEVLRAAASWPGEYLYPRPNFTSIVNASQLNPVDRFGAGSDASSSSKEAYSRSSSDSQARPYQNPLASSLTPPSNAVGSTNPPPVPPDPIVILPPPVPQPPPALLDALTTFVNDPTSNPDPVIQALSDTVTSTVSSTVTTATDTVKRTTKKATTASRRKASSTQQKIANTTSTATSTARNMQQTVNQTQMGVTSTVTAAPNQIMTSGGMGGASGLGAGVGSVGVAPGVGPGVSGLPGTGLNGTGVAGTISGIGAGLGLGHH